MADTSRIEFRFEGSEDIKEKFILQVKQNPQIFNNFKFSRPISYSYAKSVTEGKNSNLFKDIQNTFADTQNNMTMYASGVEKGGKNYKFNNFNGYTVAHETRIINKIVNESKGNFESLVNKLNIFLKELFIYDYAYNKVWYIDYA